MNKGKKCNWKCHLVKKTTYYKDHHFEGNYCNSCLKLVQLCSKTIDKDNELELKYGSDSEEYKNAVLRLLANASCYGELFNIDDEF